MDFTRSHPTPLQASEQLRKARRAFTLIEVVIVVAIILILTTIGISLSSGLIPRYRARRAANTFASHVSECRMLAVRSNRECMIWIVDSDAGLNDLSGGNTGEYWRALGDQSLGSDSWDYLPADADGTDSDQSEGFVDIGNEESQYYARHISIDYSAGSLGGPGTGNTNRIVFNPRGFVSNPSDDFSSNGTIDIPFVNKIARAKSEQDDFVVTIARSGIVRVDSTGGDEFSEYSSGTTMSSSSE